MQAKASHCTVLILKKENVMAWNDKMIRVLCHDSALLRLYWAGDNPGGTLWKCPPDAWSENATAL